MVVAYSTKRGWVDSKMNGLILPLAGTVSNTRNAFFLSNEGRRAYYVPALGNSVDDATRVCRSCCLFAGCSLMATSLEKKETRRKSTQTYMHSTRRVMNRGGELICTPADFRPSLLLFVYVRVNLLAGFVFYIVVRVGACNSREICFSWCLITATATRSSIYIYFCCCCWCRKAALTATPPSSSEYFSTVFFFATFFIVSVCVFALCGQWTSTSLHTDECCDTENGVLL